MRPDALRPIQLIPTAEAVPGTIATDLPVYERKACAGCALTAMCEARGNATAFRVREVRGTPRPCKRIGGDVIACVAEHVPSLEPMPRRRSAPAKPVKHWLVDANVLIDAAGDANRPATVFVAGADRDYTIGTTTRVRDELRHSYRTPPTLGVVPTGRPHPELMLARERIVAEGGKRPSDADLSLAQALIEHAEFTGIVTADGDVHRLEVRDLVKRLTGRDVEVLTCGELVRRRPNRFRTTVAGA